ncbi:hypothetical protein P152DRAFT_452215 [Eremomyces bilateralis CBS 781.70]|uniref:Uncharacterized protein n=1 Tax=Eremomyces bilateralis CBS 781.70 TaxID=1392243 RepID=A0A6G1FTJ8_9PEZI|nr:uncharacterized protein P152DRAFT_452215 [Eremomyces bilateralis CBS 781.70]KAF1809094.1 hypothetical protein P152DRAFT_452215 [Eremomyces bilateralis CBS 781.70]
MKWYNPLATVLIGASFAIGIWGKPLEVRDTSSSSLSLPSGALFETTISGKAITIEASLPTATSSISSQASSTQSLASEASSPGLASSTSSSTAAGSTASPSTQFPVCRDTDQAFCQPSNSSELYIGETYYVTWNPDFFAENSTITIILNYYNDTGKQAWSSPGINNNIGYTTVKIDSSWLQGSNANNLTFIALQYSGSSKAFDGPHVGITTRPVEHLPPNITKTNPKNLALWVGLPVVLGFILIVLVGITLGFRKHRKIGLGNIMSRTRHGYGSRKNRNQRVALGKKGAIRLQDREVIPPEQEFRDQPAVGGQWTGSHANARNHTRDTSFGSLVSNEDDRRNVFRDEIDRQRTGK